MASRSPKIARLLEAGTQQNQAHHTHSVTDVPGGPKALELVARFCDGYEPEFSPETVVPSACAAAFLGMTDDHGPDGNLLGRALAFFASRVLPSWNETLRALRSAEPVVPHAARLGLVDACLRSIAEKALADPHLLGNPVEVDLPPRDGAGAKRRLFLEEYWCAEDLTALPLDLYVPAIAAVARSGVAPEHVARCLHRYARKRANVGSAAPSSSSLSGDGTPLGFSEYEKSRQRRVVEAVEQLLPREKGTLPIKCLFELLQSAISLRASHGCRSGLEARIGRLLAEASLVDLFIQTHGYASETQLDVDCVQRLLLHFCSDFYTYKCDLSELGAVAELFEEFLAVAARDAGLRKERFVSLLETLSGLLESAGRCSDGAYRAVDEYLAAHGHLTESEREEVCRALDCWRLSAAACEHFAQNERMPLRAVAQALFVGQLHIRESIACAAKDAVDGGPGEKEVSVEEGKLQGEAGEEREEEDEQQQRQEEMEAREELLKMKGKAAKRPKTKRKAETCCRCGGLAAGMKRRKLGFWKEMKRKLGCRNGMYQCSCNTKNINGAC